jgi:predicted  nucleic acid-binding Zn-ribbon protein
MLVYTAGITMIVVEVAASLAKLEALTRDLGGFLARRDNVSITLRVPVARFDEAVRRVEAMGEVVHRNVTVEDVTEEFTDLEVRLKNLRAIRARLEKLLEKAKSVEEAVLLERELGRVAGEIDRIEGRMKLLKDRAAYSTITVSLRERQREAIDRSPELPVDWLGQLGLGRLLQL